MANFAVVFCLNRDHKWIGIDDLRRRREKFFCFKRISKKKSISILNIKIKLLTFELRLNERICLDDFCFVR